MGVTPLKKCLEFANSQHQTKNVLVTKKGYEDSKLQIAYNSGESAEYHINLRPVETVPVELQEVGIQEKIIIKTKTLAYLEVIERSPNVKSVTRITNYTNEDGQIDAPVMSPSSNILVYSILTKEKDGKEYSNIWRTVAGSFSKTRVTYGKWLDTDPAFRPGGNSLLFSSNRTSNDFDLWRIRIDGGSGITNITSMLGDNIESAASPDEKFIAYTYYPKKQIIEPQIWTIKSNGTLPTQLRVGESPQISPDNTKILFLRKNKLNDKKQIWIMNVDGSLETQITQNSTYQINEANWSPDGKWIVYSSDEGLNSKQLPNFDIWLISTGGMTKTQLTTNGSQDDCPCWDHEGKYIYFRSNRGGVWNIWRFEPVLESTPILE